MSGKTGSTSSKAPKHIYAPRGAFNLHSPLGKWEEDLARERLAMLRKMRAPVALGVFGGWGSGKSSLLRAMKAVAGEHGFEAGDIISAVALSPGGPDGRDRSPGHGPDEEVAAKPQADDTTGEDAGAGSAGDRVGNHVRPGWLADLKARIDSCANVASGTSSPLVLVDELDLLPADRCYSALLVLSRFLAEADEPGRDPAGASYVVVAANRDQLVEKLGTLFNSDQDADQFLGTVVAHRYEVPAPDPTDVVGTFWFWRRRDDEEDGDKRLPAEAPEGRPAFGLLWHLAVASTSGNLSRRRQLDTTLRAHLSPMEVGEQKKAEETVVLRTIRKVMETHGRAHGGDDKERKRAEKGWDAICHLMLFLLFRTRQVLPGLFAEWVARCGGEEQIAGLMDFLRGYEQAHALAPSQQAVRLTGSDVEREGLDRLERVGLDDTAAAVRDGSFGRLYRDLREELLCGWTAWEERPFAAYGLDEFLTGANGEVTRYFLREVFAT